MDQHNKHPRRGKRHAEQDWNENIGAGQGRRGRRGYGPFWFGPGRRGRPDSPFGPFDPAGEGPFGCGVPPRRQRRGDLRFALLGLLAEQPRHGYDLIKELERRFGGFYRPSPGSVYPTLQLLEDEGHLTSATVEGKRTYTITASGRQLLAERPHSADHGQPRAGRASEPAQLNALRERAEALAGAVTQAARHGSPAQVQAVQTILDRARREIYEALASETTSDS
jgi:DNA-binding PadR family transcriptional regulator